jgi:effector-binding domain-containing protein
MDPVTVAVVEARPTAVVAAAVTWDSWPDVWRPMLDEVYACMRRNGNVRQGANVMLYLDDTPHVEVGVEFINPCALDGQVKRSALPAGQVARTVHRGPYEDLGLAHNRVRQWCAAHGHGLAGPLWEIYGDWRENPADLETEVYHLLS